MHQSVYARCSRVYARIGLTKFFKFNKGASKSNLE